MPAINADVVPVRLGVSDRRLAVHGDRSAGAAELRQADGAVGVGGGADREGERRRGLQGSKNRTLSLLVL